jgi:hypothetical protein
MHSFSELAKSESEGDAISTFLVRWRGQKQGPYTAEVIERKLASNEIGLLHEIYHNDRWLTIRDFLGEREKALRSAELAKEESERIARAESERQAKEREEQRQAQLLAEERRRNDLMEATLRERRTTETSPPTPKRPHRGGLILALGIVGLFIGFLGIFAWAMGNADLREMEAGTMDPAGASATAAGRTCGAAATLLWVIGLIVIFGSVH